jgi:DNA mismatch repair protein MutL
MPVGTQPQNIRPPQTNFNPNYNPFGTEGYKRPELNWEQLYGSFEKEEKPFNSTLNPESSTGFPSAISYPDHEQQQTIENLETRAENFQYKNRYILTGIKSGLLMIDQHRAHTRILFELFLNQIKNSQRISQQILFPEMLELNAGDALFFEQIIPDLQNIGFVFEKSENHTFSVNSIPSQLGTGSVIDLLLEILEKTKTTALDPTVGIHETIALTLAEAASLKAGQQLSNEEMSDLIDRLFACSNHNYTPDGKKIIIVLSQEDIEKRF